MHAVVSKEKRRKSKATGSDIPDTIREVTKRIFKNIN
jgi:hypothetical protein